MASYNETQKLLILKVQDKNFISINPERWIYSISWQNNTKMTMRLQQGEHNKDIKYFFRILNNKNRIMQQP